MRALLLALLLASVAARSSAAGFPAPEQAMGEAFPGARIEKKTWALPAERVSKVESLSGSKPDSRLVAGFLAWKGDALAGIGVLDAHVVRTKPQALLVAMMPDLSVLRVEVLAFDEPRDYLAPEKWRRQFDGRRLDGELALKRGIRGITGATLTSRATTDAVRRALAVAQVLREMGLIPAAPAAAPPAAAASR